MILLETEETEKIVNTSKEKIKRLSILRPAGYVHFLP